MTTLTPDAAKMRAGIMMLAMSQHARDALRQMNLEDEKQVRIIRNLLRAGALGSTNTLRLLAKLQDKGVKPSRDALERLAKAVREQLGVGKVVRLPLIHPRRAE